LIHEYKTTTVFRNVGTSHPVTRNFITK